MFNEENIQEYIKLLDLPDHFDYKILKIAYRKMVLKYHPDKAQNIEKRKQLEQIMKKINEANENLKKFLEINNGQYSSTKFEQQEEKTQETSKTCETNHYSYKYQTQSDIIQEDDEMDLFKNDEELNEHYKHIYNDNEQEFEEYIKNLSKNFKDNRTKEMFINSEIEHYKEEQFNSRYGKAGILFILSVVILGLGVIIDNDWLTFIGFILSGITVILGWIIIIRNFFKSL